MAETEEKLAGEEPADEASQEPKEKKKGGKLPVILALVLLLGGGGFFAMKLKAKGAAKAPELKLGEIVPLREFLVNLKGSSIYARVEVSVQVKEGFTKESLEKARDAVEEAVHMTLSNHTLQEVETYDGKIALKREFADVINQQLSELAPSASGHATETNHGGRGEPKREASKEGAAKEVERAHPSWDSETGPVLRVYLKSFTTQ